MCRQFAMPGVCSAVVSDWDGQISLAGRLRRLSDPRDRRGRRHSLWSVILVAASAVVAGSDSYAAIGQWVARAPQATLARLGVRLIAGLGIRVPPSAATIRRLIEAVCSGGLTTLTGADTTGARTAAVDGKKAPRITVRRCTGRAPVGGHDRERSGGGADSCP